MTLNHKWDGFPVVWLMIGMCMIMGLMIGSGIFSTPAEVMTQIGAPGVVLILWIIGGLASLCGALTYVELGTMLPQSGGEKNYFLAAYKKPKYLLSFLFCWCMILIIRPGSAAADSIVFSNYLLYPVYEKEPPLWIGRAVAALGVTVIILMTMFSTRLTLLIHDGVTVFKVGLLLLICIMGLLVGSGATPQIPKADNFNNMFSGASTNGGTYAAVLLSIMYTYDGWNNLNYSAGELKDPEKNLPIAAGVGVSLVVFLYVITNISYLAVIPLEKFSSSGTVLASTFFTICFGETVGAKVLPIFIALSSFGSVCAMVFSVSRVIQTAAAAGYLPYGDFFATVHPKYKTPVNALLFVWCEVMILLFAIPSASAFDFIVEMISYPQWLFYGLAAVGLLVLRRTEPLMNRPFHVPLMTTYIFILFATFLVIFPFFPSDSPEFPFYLPPLISIFFILLGIPVWYVRLDSKSDKSIETLSPEQPTIVQV